MDGIQDHPEESGRRSYSNNRPLEMLDPPPTTQTSNAQSWYNHESISFNALPLNDAYPLSRPPTEWSGSPPSTAGITEHFQITIRDLTGRAFILNEITSSMKVSKLKEKFEAKEGIPTYDQKLIFEGKELINGTVNFYLLPICQ